MSLVSRPDNWSVFRDATCKDVKLATWVVLISCSCCVLKARTWAVVNDCNCAEFKTAKSAVSKAAIWSVRSAASWLDRRLAYCKVPNA